MRFVLLNKAQKALWLPKLFDLLYENMQSVAPVELPYGQAKEAWLAEVSPALEKAPRQVIMCLEDAEPVGYLQYYVRDTLLMVEELQLSKAHRQTTAFLGLCRYLSRRLPPELKTVEAYAHEGNLASIKLMGRLGMILCDDDAPARLVHLRGDAAAIRARFGGRG